MKRISAALLALTLLCALTLSGCKGNEPVTSSTPAASYDLTSLPDYSGDPYVAVNDNVPYFTEDDYTTNSFESYSELDALGRCGVAYACVGSDLMPTEDRESISSVKPSGWINVEYDGQYLYNRCHLIGFQLTGENANEKNLITGTRYMNVDGMLPFENMVADYVKETDNHVLYRVTPVFAGGQPGGLRGADGGLQRGGQRGRGHLLRVRLQRAARHYHRLRHRSQRRRR